MSCGSKRTARFLSQAFVVGMLAVPNCFSQTQADQLEQHFKAAQAFLMRGEQTKAADEYEMFLAEALHRTANAKARSGGFTEAEKDYKEALKLAPDDASLRLDYAEACLDAGKISAAADFVQRLLKTDPANTRVRLLYAQVLVEQQKVPEAKTQLQAVADRRDVHDSWYPLVIAQLKVQDLIGAQRVLRQMLPTLGDTADTHLHFGLAYFYGDYPDEAAKELNAALAKDPSVLDAHYYLGLSYLGHNEEAGFGRAMPEFHAELKLNPSDFRSYFMLGYIALKQRAFKEAERDLLKAQELSAEDVSTKLLLGQLYDETDRPELAESDLREIIAWSVKNAVIDNRVVRAHYILGRSLQKSGHASEGAGEIKLSEALRQQLGPATVDRSQSLSSIAGSQRKTPSLQDKRAADDFVVRLSPLMAEVYNNLGGIAANRKDFAEAISCFMRAKEWDPSLEGLDQNLARARHDLDAAHASPSNR